MVGRERTQVGGMDGLWVIGLGGVSWYCFSCWRGLASGFNACNNRRWGGGFLNIGGLGEQELGDDPPWTGPEPGRCGGRWGR